MGVGDENRGASTAALQQIGLERRDSHSLITRAERVFIYQHNQLGGHYED